MFECLSGIKMDLHLFPPLKYVVLSQDLNVFAVLQFLSALLSLPSSLPSMRFVDKEMFSPFISLDQVELQLVPRDTRWKKNFWNFVHRRPRTASHHLL
jgi:hypothetical protein